MSLQCDGEVVTLNMKGINPSFHQKTNLLETMGMDFFLFFWSAS